MFRTRAVRQLLLEEIGGVTAGSSEGTAGAGEDDPRALLERSRRRAIMVVAIDWIAILILVFARARGGQAFGIGPNEDSIFSLGLLAIAVHSGFRLGQIEKLQAVSRTLDEIDDRSRPVVEGPDPP